MQQQDDSVELDPNDDIGTNYQKFEQLYKDEQVMKAYKKAIISNKHLFKGKIVLDIECGMGVLSVLAAKAGASKVYAVDKSSIVEYTKKVVEKNGFGQTIEVIKGKVEEISLPTQVDIIICQWFGWFMVFDSLIPSVIMAREKFLVEGGLILPDRGTLWIASIEDETYRDKKFSFWKKLYGVNMSCMVDWVATEPTFENVAVSHQNSEPYAIFEVDLNKATLEDLNFSNHYSLYLTRNDFVHGIIGWFDITFTKTHIPINISSAPNSKGTQWKQTVFYFKETLACHNEDVIKGSFALKHRGKDIDVLVSAHLKNRFNKWDLVHYYRMN